MARRAEARIAGSGSEREQRSVKRELGSRGTARFIFGRTVKCDARSK